VDRLCVCLDARLISGSCGGVESVVIGLAAGLSKLPEATEEYLFLTYDEADEWLDPYLSGACRKLCFGPAPHKRIKHCLKPILKLLRVGRGSFKYNSNNIARSNGIIEQAGVKIMHFTTQMGFLTKVDSIYHPHDLQHVHMPELFDRYSLSFREVTYRTFCDQAKMIAVASSFTQDDVIRHLGVPSDKVQLVPLAPIVGSYTIPTQAELIAIRHKYNLPERFGLYPAQTWPHKNHIGLASALALLRDKYATRVSLVCCGQQNDYYTSIRQQITRLKLQDQIRFLGFIPTSDLRTLHAACRCIVVPTLFEGASGPLWDGFEAGVPVACSNVTSLPDQAGDAALVFDPNDVEDMAAAIARLWKDDALCSALVDRGRRRIARFTWERTAKHFRAHYRRIAGRLLTAEDREILAQSPEV
jgi:glycosyltransferase involved in cell wall biosynthesis